MDNTNVVNVQLARRQCPEGRAEKGQDFGWGHSETSNKLKGEPVMQNDRVESVLLYVLFGLLWVFENHEAGVAGW